MASRRLVAMTTRRYPNPRTGIEHVSSSASEGRWSSINTGANKRSPASAIAGQNVSPSGPRTPQLQLARCSLASGAIDEQASGLDAGNHKQRVDEGGACLLPQHASAFRGRLTMASFLRHAAAAAFVDDCLEASIRGPISAPLL
jgi:hypothetical protein